MLDHEASQSNDPQPLRTLAPFYGLPWAAKSAVAGAYLYQELANLSLSSVFSSVEPPERPFEGPLKLFNEPPLPFSTCPACEAQSHLTVPIPDNDQISISGAPRLLGSPLFLGKADCRHGSPINRPLGTKLSLLAVRAFMSFPLRGGGGVGVRVGGQ
jgi:hypothetical protein